MCCLNFALLEVKALTGRSTMSSHKMSENLLQLVGVLKCVCILSGQIPLVLTIFLQIDSCSAELSANVIHVLFLPLIPCGGLRKLFNLPGVQCPLSTSYSYGYRIH